MTRNYCRGLCVDTGIKRCSENRLRNISSYLLGYKYCRRCELFFKFDPKTDKIYCKCCGNPLRSTGSGSKRWQKYRDSVVVRY